MKLPEDMQCDPTMRRGNCLVSFREHGIPWIEFNMLRQHTMSELVDFKEEVKFLKEKKLVWSCVACRHTHTYTITHHNCTKIARFKLGECQIDGLQHVAPKSLSQQGVEINGSSKKLYMSLFHYSDIAIGRRIRELVGSTFGSKLLVQ